jgi:hypothetical protein
MLMNRGYGRVRPLEGGLDAWEMTGREYALYDAAPDGGDDA